MRSALLHVRNAVSRWIVVLGDAPGGSPVDVRGDSVSRRAGSGLVVACAVLFGCGARSTLTPSEKPDSASGAAGSSGACPVRARPRLNAVGSATSVPTAVQCLGPPVSLAEPCPGKCGNDAIDDCALTDNAV